LKTRKGGATLKTMRGGATLKTMRGGATLKANVWRLPQAAVKRR